MSSHVALLASLFILAWLMLYIYFRDREGRVRVYPFLLVVRMGVSGEPLSPYSRLRRAVSLAGFASLVLTLIAMAAFYYLAVTLFMARYGGGGGGGAPGGFIPLIPGVTIPLDDLAYILFALGLAALVHELAHAVAARAEGVRVKDGGIALIAFIPAAFVEPDEDQFRASPLVSRLKVYSAGVAVNLVVFAAAIALLSVAAPYYSAGVAVLDVEEGSPADLAGIEPGMIIVAVNGEEVRSLEDLARYFSEAGVTNSSARAVVVLEVVYEGERLSITVEKPEGRSTIGVSVANYYSSRIVPILLSLYVLNLGLALVNAAPIAIPLPGNVILSDGGHILVDVLERLAGPRGRALGVAIGVATLVMVISLLSLTPLRITP